MSDPVDGLDEVDEAPDGEELDEAFAVLLPDADQLEQVPVRERVAIFEDLQTRLADELDDADA